MRISNARANLNAIVVGLIAAAVAGFNVWYQRRDGP